VLSQRHSASLVFGYGLSLDVENIPFGVVHLDRTPASRDFAHRFISSRYFNVKGSCYKRQSQ
jgi:ABC-2 type transport system permease protein